MKLKLILNEIDELIKKPQPWGPMVVSRVKMAMEQAVTALRFLDAKNNDLQQIIELQKTHRSDAIVDRNVEIMNRYMRGVSMIKMAEEYGLSRQRVHMIIVTMQKQLESQNGSTRTKRVSKTRNRLSQRATRAGKEKDRITNSNRRR